MDFKDVFDKLEVIKTKKMLITLTYAQSIDGFIGSLGQNLILSSPESFKLTHKLRNYHEAIIIGINTLSNDNPSLSTRLDDDDDDGKLNLHHPMPVILDPSLRILDLLDKTEFKILRPLINGDKKRKVVIYCSVEIPFERFEEGKRRLTGIEVKMVSAKFEDTHCKLDFEMVFKSLENDFGIKSAMVEGGSRIISGLLDSNLYDALIITISPKFIPGGVHVSMGKLKKAVSLKNPTYIQAGVDIIVLDL